MAARGSLGSLGSLTMSFLHTGGSRGLLWERQPQVQWLLQGDIAPALPEQSLWRVMGSPQVLVGEKPGGLLPP